MCGGKRGWHVEDAHCAMPSFLVPHRRHFVLCPMSIDYHTTMFALIRWRPGDESFSTHANQELYVSTNTRMSVSVGQLVAPISRTIWRMSVIETMGFDIGPTFGGSRLLLIVIYCCCVSNCLVCSSGPSCYYCCLSLDEIDTPNLLGVRHCRPPFIIVPYAQSCSCFFMLRWIDHVCKLHH